MTLQQKILILDDDPEILELLTRILGKKYTLLTKTGTENLEQDIASFQPDAIMIDHFIGEKTSNEVTESLSKSRHIPVILHSAHEEIEKLSIETKVAAYIRKPTSINEMRECIERVLAGK